MLNVLALHLCVCREGGEKEGREGKAGGQKGTEVTLELKVWDLFIVYVYT